MTRGIDPRGFEQVQIGPIGNRRVSIQPALDPVMHGVHAGQIAARGMAGEDRRSGLTHGAGAHPQAQRFNPARLIKRDIQPQCAATSDRAGIAVQR